MAGDSSSVPGAPTRAVPTQPASSGTNVLNQKYGPFPVWVYLAAVGIGLYAYEKHKGTSASASTTTGTTPPDNGSATGVASENAVEETLQANVGAATTNPQWEANVESVLVGYGYPTVQVQSALNTYLAGGQLSSIQQEIVNAAIEAVGAPPSPPSTTTNSPTTPPPTTPTPSPPTHSNPPPASTGTETPSKGFGTITIGGKQYAILGRAGSQVYQVGGGAPVYFGNGNSVAQGSAAEQAAAKSGGYAYTPIEYIDQIAQKPTSEAAGKF